jgi:tetratricopeptide (TPR) repeat protein
LTRQADRHLADLRRAARRTPRDARIQHDLGLALMNQRQFAPALAAFDCAVKLDPAFGAAHFRRGIMLELLNRNGADAAYARAIAEKFEFAGAYSRLAALREQAGQRGEAASLYIQAALRSAGTVQGALDRAQAALIEGDYAIAETQLRAVLAAVPEAGGARGQLGHILAARGDFAAASAYFEQALRDAPAEVGIYYDLLQLRRVGPDDDALLDRLRAALDVPAAPRARLRLQLALAKAYDDRGAYQQAEAALRAADAIRVEQSRFDAAGMADRTARLKRLFTGDFIARADHKGNASDLPVLVVGMPRSGTTLVERILASHPSMAGAGEVHFWEAQGRAVLAADIGDAALDLRVVAAQYLALLRQAGRGAARVVDKMPFNVPWAALVHLALPKARMIHCRRNAADTCLSIMFADLHASGSFSAARDDLKVIYQDYETVIAHMRAILPPSCFLEIDYEALVAAPEAQARRLVAFCGLDWDDACLAPERGAGLVRTASLWQARQKIHGTSVGRAERYAAWLAPFITQRKE